MAIFQFLLHYFLHLVFPVFIAYRFFRPRWKQAYAILLLTMLVDLDHLLASPVFQACRCSINFHPLHTYIACVVYALLLFHRRTRLVGIGLLLHMITDGLDCLFSSYNCP